MRPCSSLADAVLIRVARLALAIEAGETPHGSGVLRRQVPLAEVIERFGAPPEHANGRRGLPRRPSCTGQGAPESRRQAFIFFFRFSSSLARKSWVLRKRWSLLIRIARSLVMSPASTVSMQTASSALAKSITSCVPSNLPR